ncbi:hypothetical protein GCM10009818_06690 [Nakamurella flavida]
MGGVLDAIESWVAGRGYWIQVVVLLAVLLPLCFWLAGVIDRLVERVLGHGDPVRTPAGGAADGGRS